MMDKDKLKKLKRTDLLEMMISQSKENESLKQQLDEALNQLKQREIRINNAGSIAEAALQLNGVFEAAQKAAVQYLENIERLSREQEIENSRIIEESEKKASQLISETQKKCQELERDTKERCEQMVSDAERDSKEHWDIVSQKLDQFYESHEEIQDIISIIGQKGSQS